MPSYIVGQPIGDLDAGESVTISVVVNSDATHPVLYQWFRNNIAIAGAVDAVYTFNIQVEDSYASYTVFVQNPCGDELSAPSVVGEVFGQDLCKVYECDAYELAVLGLAGLELFYRADLSDAYDVGVNIARFPDLTGQGRVGYFNLGTFTTPPVGYITTCDPQNIAYFNGGGGSTSTTTPEVRSDATDIYRGLVNNCTISCITNGRSTGSNLLGFDIEKVNTGNRTEGWDIYVSGGTLVMGMWNSNYSDNVRFTSTELGVDWALPHLLAVHIKRTSSLITMIIWVDGAEVFNGTQDRLRGGATTLLSADANYQQSWDDPPDPSFGVPPDVQRGPKWGAFSSTGVSGAAYAGSHLFMVSGSLGSANAAWLYSEYERNKLAYVDPNPNCRPPT